MEFESLFSVCGSWPDAPPSIGRYSEIGKNMNKMQTLRFILFELCIKKGSWGMLNIELILSKFKLLHAFLLHTITMNCLLCNLLYMYIPQRAFLRDSKIEKELHLFSKGSSPWDVTFAVDILVWKMKTTPSCQSSFHLWRVIPEHSLGDLTFCSAPGVLHISAYWATMKTVRIAAHSIKQHVGQLP